MKENRFNGKGSYYAKQRPSYPTEFIDYLYDEIGMTAESVIADIGAGTGKLTKLLLERGSTVYAVEPNNEMRARAEADLGSFANFFSLKSRAEETLLDDNSVDYVTVATAFHWFDRESFRAECRRILRAAGKVVIVYNSRVEDSDIVKALYRVNEKFSPAFSGFVGSGNLLRPENAGHFRDFFGGDYVTKIIPNDLVYDETSFVGRCLSSSYALTENDENYPEYVQALKQLFQEYSRDNRLIMPNVTHSYIGEIAFFEP